jgi:signal transduction histidine kinase/ligand-binding sensor domain-containing protein
VLSTIVASCIVTTIHAIDPERAPSQYIRDRWEGRNGFPGGPVYAITQSVDGNLWIAAEKGLVRFDGLSFRLFQPTDLASGVDTVSLQIAPAPDGTLWARLRRADFVRYRDGAYDHVPSDPGFPWLSTAMSSATDGSMLIADQRRGLFVVRGGRFDMVVPKGDLPESFVMSIAQMPNGEVWLGTRDAGLVRVRGGKAMPVTDGLPDQKINCLATEGRDQLWVGTDNGVVRWDGQRVTGAGLPAALAGVRATAMIKDRDDNLWIATADGLIRVNSRGVARLDKRTAGFAVTALFEDRDGDLWIGTASGIERWRDGAFTSYPDVHAVATGDGGPIFVDTSGRVWFGPSSGGLYWLDEGRVGRVTAAGLSDEVIYSLDGTGNDLWIGRQRGGLTHLRTRGDSFTSETYTQANGLSQNNVYAVHHDRDGGVWAGTLSGGVSRLKDGVFTTYTTADGLASNTVASVLQAADGTTWFATPSGASTRSASGWQRYSTTDGLPSNDVNTVFEDSAHQIWMGTAAGIAVVHDGRVQSGLQLPDSLRASILGIAEDTTGWLWIASADRVLRVNRERLLQGTLGDNDVRDYGAADGLLGIEGVKRHRSLTADAHGRIWLSTSGGLAMVDPVRIAGRSAPALVHVEGLSADGGPVRRDGDISVPPRRQRLTIAFACPSLSAPERVRFRYRLDGFDRDWSAPGSARQAEYTNLGPGAYTFHVIASNADGIWSANEATLPFTIEPAFWQTLWFRLSAIGLLTAAIWGAYQAHVAQVSRQLSLRFEERLGERTRIARDLHDTLLQSFHGVLLRFQAVAFMLPDHPAEARKTLESAVDQAARAITEGRDAVQGLRSSIVAAYDLPRAISTLGEELAVEHVNQRSPNFSVRVEGTPRALAPLLGDEVYRIAGEALRNAFRHAHASQIEVDIRYDRKQFRLRIRDDGKGINPAVLDGGGQAGHFGLAGMQERAKLVGGTLTVWSELESGTEGELTIPASVAYAKAPVDASVSSSTGA